MAPESALADLRLRAAADGNFGEGGGRPLHQRLACERSLLVAWAREKGFALPAEELLSHVTGTHGEHHVFYDTARPRRTDRFIKITHGVDPAEAGFALTVDTDFRIGKASQRYIGVPFLREATPFEYLARLRLFNLIFRDYIELEGVIDMPGHEAIVTSQEFIHGHAATDHEVAGFMRQRSFAQVPGVVAGRRESVTYFRAHDSAAVFDTHGQNFIVSGARMVPIDALVIYADDELSTFLSMQADERAQEIGLWTSQMHG